ncbi:MAG TPA: hypothetical protein VK494_05730 [Gemmatimonadaceae bacterium]|nr:hypothetical protein [Gemmatimonadaceae bacterium]
MLVQYLVGLCCVHANPDAVDVIVGDMVVDSAAGKPRDVDVTVSQSGADGILRAFKAYEVKREGEPLDVAVVEQLYSKLIDMPSVTHRAIVSASGYTNGAIAKAAAHKVDLFVLKPWTKPLDKQFREFPNIGPPDEFVREVSSTLLFWIDCNIQILTPSGPSSFIYERASPLFNRNGKPHPQFASLSQFIDAVLLRSTEILFALEPAQTVLRLFPFEPVPGNEHVETSPAWPHTHTISVEDDGVFLAFDSRLIQVTSMTVSGRLQWQTRRQSPEFHILVHVPSEEAFAGAAVAPWGTPDGKMLAMVFSPNSRAVGFHTIQLTEKHRNAIRRLSLFHRDPGADA